MKHNVPAKADATSVLEGESILSFSLERWSSVWRSRHQIMSRVSRANRILFASSPFYIRDIVRSYRKPNAEPTGVSRVTNNLYGYIPPYWLPVSYGYPKLDSLIKNIRCWLIRRKLSQLAMKRPILYIWHPSFADMVGRFEEALVVYHCYDEYSAFHSKQATKDVMAAQEQTLLKRADIVFAASDELCARRRAFNPNIHVVENGVNYALFSQAQEAQTIIPEDLLVIRRPIIGYVGTQTTETDLALLVQVFRHRQDWSLVFIGIERAPEHQVEEALKALQRLPNVHFIGRRTLQEIPAYLKGCDVCAIPWVLNGITMASSSPLKMYEYLAAGKPVISTPLPLLRHLHPVITFAADANEWIRAIDTALQNDTPAKIAERQKIARENTWERRVDFISRKLAEELSTRRRP